MSKLFYKEKAIIGLDISQTGVKVMAIDPKHWLVLGYGSLDLDPARVQGSLDNPEDTYLSESIKGLLKQNIVGTLNSNHVIVGLPTSRTFSRTFTIPASQVSHIADAVEIEVDQYIPIPLSSLYLDYEVIEKDKNNATIIMSAVPKTLVDSCTAAARSAGLTPIAAEPSINAVARVLRATEDGHLVTLIVDIGAASTDIAVLDRGFIRVTGSVNIGGNTLTLDIAKKMDVALENAHQFKVLNGLNAGPRQAKITSALKPSLDRIASEIRKVIRYYNERLVDDRKIEQILIVGGGANLPGIGEYYTNELVMPARVASPWQSLNFGKLPEPNKQFRSRYITVTGLASVKPGEVWDS
ncbi:MAG: type IV pilus assembly protein PilM [Candidatus Saccharimonas sp.]